MPASAKMSWPGSVAGLIAAQETLGRAAPPAWRLPPSTEAPPLVGACFIAYGRGQAGPGHAGDLAWSAAVAWRPDRERPGGTRQPRRSDRALTGTGPSLPRRARDVVDQAMVPGFTGDSYRPGLLALREGPLLEAAVLALRVSPEVLLVDATGRDHPRRAGLAVHLGAVLDLPTVGVTHRALVASGDLPPLERGRTAPLVIGDEVVGYWVCTRSGARPVIAHAAWRTDPDTAAELVLASSTEGARTPVPLLEARRVARETRALAEGRTSSSQGPASDDG